MNIYELGKEGEKEARLLLRGLGYYIGQSDWIGKKDGRWVRFEIKRKERFMPPPFEGHGLDIRQINYAKEFQRDTGIATVLIIYEIGTNKWFARRIDELEKTGKDEKHDTKNGIRIYKLSNFVEIKRSVKQGSYPDNGYANQKGKRN